MNKETQAMVIVVAMVVAVTLVVLTWRLGDESMNCNCAQSIVDCQMGGSKSGAQCEEFTASCLADCQTLRQQEYDNQQALARIEAEKGRDEAAAALKQEALRVRAAKQGVHLTTTTTVRRYHPPRQVCIKGGVCYWDDPDDDLPPGVIDRSGP